jgi:hypothetical protein
MENYHCWHLPHDILYSSTANEQPVLQNTFLICSNHLSLQLSTQNTFQHWQQDWVAWFSSVQQDGIVCSHIHEHDNKASLYNHNCRWSKTLLFKGLCRFDDIWNAMAVLANNSNLKFHKRHCSRPLVKCPRGPKIPPPPPPIIFLITAKLIQVKYVDHTQKKFSFRSIAVVLSQTGHCEFGLAWIPPQLKSDLFKRTVAVYRHLINQTGMTQPISADTGFEV